MTLEEIIKQRLEEATKEADATQVVVEETTEMAAPVVEQEVAAPVVEQAKPQTIKAQVTEKQESSNVSSQVSALLEAEGLSEEFKVQAVTIFEAAVTDRVLQITEELEAQYNEKLDEATAEIENNIDGFLNEAVQQWAKDNEVAIASNFKTRLAESFMDGLQSLLAEHNIDLPEEKVDALDAALEQVHELEESAEEVQSTVAQLQEQISELKAEKILESFKEKMTSTEFDRFVQLTESVKFKDEAQYEKQLTIVLENFGKVAAPKVVEKQVEVAPIVEDVQAPVQTVVTEQYSNVNVYAKYLAERASKF
jgi:hypothetical protein